MKSVSDPCISDDTARKNATPSTMPDSETRLWRCRARRCFSAIAGDSPIIAAPPAVSGEPVVPI